MNSKRTICFRAYGLKTFVMPMLFILVGIFTTASIYGASDRTELRGSISGTVSVGLGTVRGFQVKARDTAHRITYTVFTRSGRYRVPNLVAANYEIWVVQPGFQFPVQQIDLKTGESRNLDLTGKQLEQEPPKAQLVDYDTLYPPKPGRAVLERNCMGCHGRNSYQHLRIDEGHWRKLVDNMTSNNSPSALNGITARPNLPADEKESIIQYLSETFGVNSPARDLKLDELQVDETEVGDAIYTEYELPPPTKGNRGLWDLNIANDGMMWLADSTANSVDRFNPLELDFQKRFKEFPISSPKDVHDTGITSDMKTGHVYFGEAGGGHLGELDPKTGEMTQYKMPVLGAMHSVEMDSKGNVWSALIYGNKIVKWDPRAKQFKTWDIPTVDAVPYSMIVDKNDKVWYAAIAKHLIGKFDPVTEKFTEYPTPTQPSGPRRLGADSKGKIWFGEFFGQSLGYLDPETGKMVDYKFPLRYTQGYEAWADHDDNIWVSDNVYNSLIKFEQKTKKFTYFPLPRVQPSGIPKIRVAKDGTIWFGFRLIDNVTLVSFKPKGNRDAN